MIYLASPYSDPDPAVRRERFIAACRAAGRLMSNGQAVYSPIAHSHPIAEVCDLPKAWEFWVKVDREFLARCHKLIVLRLPGWESSAGIKAEVAMAEEMEIEVGFMERDAAP